MFNKSCGDIQGTIGKNKVMFLPFVKINSIQVKYLSFQKGIFFELLKENIGEYFYNLECGKELSNMTPKIKKILISVCNYIKL